MRMMAWCPSALSSRVDTTLQHSRILCSARAASPFRHIRGHRSAREQKSAIDLRGPLPVTPRHSER